MLVARTLDGHRIIADTSLIRVRSYEYSTIIRTDASRACMRYLPTYSYISHYSKCKVLVYTLDSATTY